MHAASELLNEVLTAQTAVVRVHFAKATAPSLTVVWIAGARAGKSQR